MIALAALVVLISTSLIVPGWICAKRSGNGGVAVMSLPLVGIGMWFALSAMGVGAQSLSNIIEIFPIAVLSIAVAYLVLFALRRRLASRHMLFSVAVGAVVMFVVCLRLLVPVLPE